MADIDIRRAHHLGPAAARTAADQMADRLGKKFGLTGDWDGDVLHFARPGVSGSLTLGPDDLHLVVTLGFLLSAMKGSIEQAIHHELDTLFAAKEETKAKPAVKLKKASPPRKKGG
jgi:putative polyhydroxyalkanoate system protein